MHKIVLFTCSALMIGGVSLAQAQTGSTSQTGASSAGATPDIPSSRNAGSSMSTSSGDMDSKPNSIDTHPSGPDSAEQSQRNR